MKKARVIVWGLGAMGGDIARLVLEKPGFELVGTIDSHPEKQVRVLSEVRGVGSPYLRVSYSHDAAVVAGAVDAVVAANMADLTVLRAPFGEMAGAVTK